MQSENSQRKITDLKTTFYVLKRCRTVYSKKQGHGLRFHQDEPATNIKICLEALPKCGVSIAINTHNGVIFFENKIHSNIIFANTLQILALKIKGDIEIVKDEHSNLNQSSPLLARTEISSDPLINLSPTNIEASENNQSRLTTEAQAPITTSSEILTPNKVTLLGLGSADNIRPMMQAGGYMWVDTESFDLEDNSLLPNKVTQIHNALRDIEHNIFINLANISNSSDIIVTVSPNEHEKASTQLAISGLLNAHQKSSENISSSR